MKTKKSKARQLVPLFKNQVGQRVWIFKRCPAIEKHLILFEIKLKKVFNWWWNLYKILDGKLWNINISETKTVKNDYKTLSVIHKQNYKWNDVLRK